MKPFLVKFLISGRDTFIFLFLFLLFSIYIFLHSFLYLSKNYYRFNDIPKDEKTNSAPYLSISVIKYDKNTFLEKYPYLNRTQSELRDQQDWLFVNMSRRYHRRTEHKDINTEASTKITNIFGQIRKIKEHDGRISPSGRWPEWTAYHSGVQALHIFATSYIRYR